MAKVFITGGTGYIGRSLIPLLLERGHEVRALVRQESQGKLPAGCPMVTGNALDAASYVLHVPAADAFIQLVGFPHPSPRFAKQFREVDLVSGLAGIEAAKQASVRHFLYVSVAHPAPVMQVYSQPRMEVEAAIRASGLNATILRPWYVLGPDHRWPYLLVPLYWLFALIPSKREMARRLGLVKLKQMVAALVAAVENPGDGVRVVEVPEIRRASL